MLSDVRVCFLLTVRADRLEEYREAPRSPVAGDAGGVLGETGWNNYYSLFLRADGLLVGYFLETPNFGRALCAQMKEHPVNARWQAEMVPFFEAIGEGGADDNMFPLEEVFHLD